MPRNNGWLSGIVPYGADNGPVGRSTDDWVKITCRQRETLPIAGFARTVGLMESLLAGQEADGLVYAEGRSRLYARR
jgi:hypothetical protein